MSDVNYALVLSRLYPGKPWVITDNDYASLDWQDESPKPTKKKLDDSWAQVQYEHNRAIVEAERRARYQAETDGLFFEAQREGGDLTSWQAAVEQIKAALPYPEAP